MTSEGSTVVKNYLRIGPLHVRVSRRGIASWGYARLKCGGLSLLDRTNGGDLVLASYHPRRHTTWHWSVTIAKDRAPEGRRWIERAPMRFGQWHDSYRLPFGRLLIVSRQDYHRRPTPVVVP